MRKWYLSWRLLVRQSGLVQIGLLIAFWAVGEVAARMTHLPIPGGILGLGLVLALLLAGRVRPCSLRRGASWLLAEMLLFFIPAVMAVLDHREFLGALGLKIMIVIAVGTLVVMGGTAMTVELFHRMGTHYERD